MGFFVNPISGEIIITPATGDSILSVPPDGKLPVKNLFVDSGTGKLEVEYEDAPVSDWNRIPSNPPTGKLLVRNLFVDPETEKLEVEYDDTPEE